MDFNPVKGGQQADGQGERPAVSYKPTRLSTSMAGSNAPIPGVEQAVQFRGVPAQQVPTGVPPVGAAPDGGGAEPDELAPEEQAARADLSKRLGILAEKDRRIRERSMRAAEAERAAKSLEQVLSTREQELAARETKLREWEDQDKERRRDPQKALRDYGYTPEAALQYMLSGGKLTPEQESALKLDEQLATERQRTQDELASVREQTEAEIKAIREEQARLDQDRQRQAEEAERAAADEQERAAVAELKADIGDIIAGDEQAFPLLSMARGGGEAVYQEVQRLSDDTFTRTGRRPPVTTKLLEQAAKSIEAAARKELDAANEKLGYRAAGAQPAPRRPQTLTNGGVQRQAPVAPPQREETPVEKRQRVVAMLEEIKRRQAGGQ